MKRKKVEANVMSNRLERIGPGLVPEEKKKPDLRKVMESFHDECKAALAAKEAELRELRRVARDARALLDALNIEEPGFHEVRLCKSLAAVERATRRSKR